MKHAVRGWASEDLDWNLWERVNSNQDLHEEVQGQKQPPEGGRNTKHSAISSCWIFLENKGKDFEFGIFTKRQGIRLILKASRSQSNNWKKDT